MIEITTIQNALMGITFFFLGLYLLAQLVDAKPHWFLSKTLLKCRKMQNEYNKLLSSRKDLLHHYYWNQANKENQKVKNIEKQIIKLDKQLLEMREQYQIIRKGLPVPLKMF